MEKLNGKFELVKPQAVFGTMSAEDGEEWDEEYSIEAYGRTFSVLLKQTKDLFSPDYKEVRLDSRGEELSSTPLSDVRTDCYYHGRVRDDPDSVVVLSTCDTAPDPPAASSSSSSSREAGTKSTRGAKTQARLARRFSPSAASSRGHGRRASEQKSFQGIIQAHGLKLYLEPAEQHAQHLSSVESGDHIIYSDADYPTAPHTCGNDAHPEVARGTATNSAPIEGVPLVQTDFASFVPFYPTAGSDTPGLSSGLAPTNATTPGEGVPEVTPLTAPASGLSSGMFRASERFETLATGSVVKYVELIAVNDYLMYASKGSATEAWVASLFNAVNALYQQGASALGYSINIRLVAQYTFASGDPYARPTSAGGDSVSSSDLLQKFSAWVGASKQAGRLATFDNAHLMSGYTFDGSTIGLAYVSGMCYTSNPSQVLSVGETRALFDASATRMATVTAHEIGHNLGMNHDNAVPAAGVRAPINTMTSSYVQTQCNAGDYLMKPAATMTAATWSPCSVLWLQDFMEQGQAAPPLKYGSAYNPMCLENSPSSSVDTTAQQCGDGIKQGNEQCDCGAVGASADPCCNCATCTLKAGASCSAYDKCCNPATCSVYTDFRVCRAAQSSCDIAETCDGSSAECPPDARMNPGTACSFVDQLGGSGSGQCYGGLCLSHQTQCLQYTQDSAGNKAGQCNAFNGWNDYGGGSACGSLVCASAAGSGCVQFGLSVVEGTPCSQGGQCRGGQCIASASMPGYDATRPTVTCPGPQTVFLAGGSSVQVPAVTVSDNVGVSSTVYSASGTRLAGRTLQAATGVYTISVVATDMTGNQASCSYTLTVSGNPCSPNPCNGGTCSVSGSSFVCSCPPGFTGATCATSPCSANPCGPGTCAVNTNTAAGYTCSCPSGYSGANCEQSLCSPNPCANGQCQLNSAAPGGFTCACPAGFSGQLCATTPCSSNPCQNGGTCSVSGSGYVCSCRNGYSGAQCQTSPCASNPCGAGTCSVNSGSATGYVCTCPAYYGGANCQVTPCSTNPCMNGGQCQLNSGSAAGYSCACPAGFSGQYCQTTPCSSNPCVRGTCSVSGSSYVCSCPPGYSGPTCATSVCDSNPCKNGGQCVITASGAFGCSCQGGWFGTDCSSGPNPCIISPSPCGSRTCYYVPSMASKYFCM